LMSATLDAKSFANYFDGAPLVEIPSAPRFPVQEVYLEDLPEALSGDARGVGDAVGTMLTWERQHIDREIRNLESVVHAASMLVGSNNAADDFANDGSDDADEGRDGGSIDVGDDFFNVADLGDDNDSSDDDGDWANSDNDDGALDGVSGRASKLDRINAANAGERIEHLQAVLQSMEVVGSAGGSGGRRRDANVGDADANRTMYGVLADVVRHIVRTECNDADIAGAEAAEAALDAAAGDLGAGAVVAPGDAEDANGDAEETLLSGGLASPSESAQIGSVLCFMSGWDEIKAVVKHLEEGRSDVSHRMLVLPLHSSLTPEEQQRVFDPAPPGIVKVVVSTNIAESSVTISDVVAIVDSGKVKELRYDAAKRMSLLETNPSSRASATQRRGRAGRVAPGRCYRLYSRPMLEGMPDRSVPEIQRMELQHTCLTAKSVLPKFPVQDVLARAMDPPAAENVKMALDQLENLGAIVSESGVFTDDGEEVEAATVLGRRLANLPVPPAVGKMLIMGLFLKCMDPATTIAALLSSRSPFVASPMVREKSRAIQKQFDASSDIEAAMKAYETWEDIINEEGFRAASKWAYDNMLLQSVLMGIQSTKRQLEQNMAKVRLIPYKRALTDNWGDPNGYNMTAGDEAVRSALVLAALPTNMARKSMTRNVGYLQETAAHADVHPSSVNCEVIGGRRVKHGNDASDWLVYNEMVSTSSVYLRTTASITPASIMMLGGYNMTDETRGGSVGMIDDWILCRGDVVDFKLYQGLRDEYNAAMCRQLRQKRTENEDELHSEQVFTTVLNLLHEGARQSRARGAGGGGGRNSFGNAGEKPPPTAEQKAEFAANGHQYTQVDRGNFRAATDASSTEKLGVVNDMIRRRRECKRRQDYDDADAIRDELKSLGVAIFDREQTWHFLK